MPLPPKGLARNLMAPLYSVRGLDLIATKKPVGKEGAEPAGDTEACLLGPPRGDWLDKGPDESAVENSDGSDPSAPKVRVDPILLSRGQGICSGAEL